MTGAKAIFFNPRTGRNVFFYNKSVITDFIAYFCLQESLLRQLQALQKENQDLKSILCKKNLTSMDENLQDKDEEENNFMDSDSSDSEFEDNSTSASETVKNLPRLPITVHMCKNTKEKRYWDKPHYCFFCKEPFTNDSKHLINMHANEGEVSKICKLPARSNKKAAALQFLRNKGNFIHNQKVLAEGKGQIIPVKSPNKVTSYESFIPCSYCFGFYNKKELWRHANKCAYAQSGALHKGALIRGKAMLASHPQAEGLVQSLVYSKMKVDDVFLAFRNDDIVQKLAKKLLLKTGHKVRSHQYISQKLREVGRFLIEIKKLDDSLDSMEKIINGRYYETIITAVLNTCNYHIEDSNFEKPTLALKIGHLLKKCASIKLGNSLMMGDSLKQEEARTYITLHEMNYPDDISSTALRTLREAKFNKPENIPSARDVAKVVFLIKKQIDVYQERLENDKQKSDWIELCSLSLASVMLFNRRRTGEVSYLLLDAYEKRAPIETDLDDEIYQALDEDEKALCLNFDRIEARGKCDNKISFLLPPKLVTVLDLLNSTRDIAGVSENKYLFANPNNGSFLEGHRCLKKYVDSCPDLNNPDSIKSTKLRKHLGTMSQLLNLSRNEMEELSRFMGHDLDVHRNFYRRPQGIIERTRVGKLLLALEKGTVAKQKGKTLEELNVDLEEFAEESKKNKKQKKPEKNSPIAEGSKKNKKPEKNSPIAEGSKKNKKRKKPEENSPRLKWTPNKKRILTNYFGLSKPNAKVPGKRDVNEFQRKHPLYQSVEWPRIKQSCRRLINNESP